MMEPVRSVGLMVLKGQTWRGAEGDPIFEAPLCREDSRAVPVTQKGPLGGLRVLNATKVIHSHEEILIIVHLKQRGARRCEKIQIAVFQVNVGCADIKKW